MPSYMKSLEDVAGGVVLPVFLFKIIWQLRYSFKNIFKKCLVEYVTSKQLTQTLQSLSAQPLRKKCERFK